MKQTTFLIILMASFYTSFCQAPTQTVRGTVIEKDTRQAVIGATVEIKDLAEPRGTVTDIDGSFILTEVPVGRHVLECSYLGFEPWISDGVIVNSARELVVDIEIKEAAHSLGEVVITAVNSPAAPVNELAVLSARSFTAEETKRYAASVSDPGRMAQSFPGVQPSKDSEGDIVIRGNSSVGLLWRLEGVDILNPNHFARLGGASGGITIFSISMLGRSDFSTGAFPAEYGNALSGVFDMKFRNGNSEKREYTFRAGMLGLDFSTEGPMKKGNGSYLMNYRYSTLGILNELGLHLVGERVDNTFQDLAFNINLPSKSGKSTFKLWGMGGLSYEKESVIQNHEEWRALGDSLQTETASDVFVAGLTNTFMVDDKSYLKTTLAAMGQEVILKRTIFSKEETTQVIQDEDHTQFRFSLASFYNRKLNAQWNLKSGFQLSANQYDLQGDTLNDSGAGMRNVIDGDGMYWLFQPYTQFSYRPSTKWTVNFGVNGMFFTLNDKISLEPRLGIKRQLSDNQSLSFAYGLHSRQVPLGSYFVKVDGETPNTDLDLIKAHHFVLAYDHQFKNSLRFHAEVYYQSLLNVPVGIAAPQTYWVFNDIEGYSEEALVSKGTGTNMGLDLTLERSFKRGIFFILNTSIFDSTFEPLNGKTYDTQYNSNFTASFTGGKEWSFDNNGVLQLGLKGVFANGLPSTPLLDENLPGASPLYDEANPLSESGPAYFRPDIRIAYRKDNPKAAWSLALDLFNAFNIKNERAFGWEFNSDLSKWERQAQSGLIPVLSFQIDL